MRARKYSFADGPCPISKRKNETELYSGGGGSRSVLAPGGGVVCGLVQQTMDGARACVAGASRQHESVLPYVITFVLNLVIAFVLAQICAWRNANTAARGAALGILIWIGFIGPMTYTTHMYEMRPVQLFAINQFYSLVGLALMGAILGAWTKKTSA